MPRSPSVSFLWLPLGGKTRSVSTIKSAYMSCYLHSSYSDSVVGYAKYFFFGNMFHVYDICPFYCSCTMFSWHNISKAGTV